MSIKVVGNGYLTIAAPYSDTNTWEKIDEKTIKNMRAWFHLKVYEKSENGTLIGKEIQCLLKEKETSVWTVANDISMFGCVVKLEKGKHLMGITVDTEQMMSVWMFASY